MSEGLKPGEMYEVDCPHCRKHFAGPLLTGRTARYHGFKCPHCKLFVPLARVAGGVATPG